MKTRFKFVAKCHPLDTESTVSSVTFDGEILAENEDKVLSHLKTKFQKMKFEADSISVKPSCI